MSQGLACKSCERTILGAALACVACGALHHEGCHRTVGHCAACTCAKPAVAVSVGGRDRANAVAILAAGLAIFGLAMGVKALTYVPPPPPQLIEVHQAQDLRLVPATVAGRWVGTISGNDPSVTADIALTQSGTEVSGVLLWSSPNSGKNERRIAGHLDPDRRLLILRDVAMPNAQANGLWHFCSVDYYLLALEGSDLVGTYWSQACNDRAKMRLHRQ